MIKESRSNVGSKIYRSTLFQPSNSKWNKYLADPEYGFEMSDSEKQIIAGSVSLQESQLDQEPFQEVYAAQILNDPIEEVMQLELQKTVQKVVRHLSKKEKKVLEVRYGLGTEHVSGHFSPDVTLAECGEVFSLTPGRIRQIEAKAMRVLRCRFHSKYLLAALLGMPAKRFTDYHRNIEVKDLFDSLISQYTNLGFKNYPLVLRYCLNELLEWSDEYRLGKVDDVVHVYDEYLASHQREVEWQENIKRERDAAKKKKQEAEEFIRRAHENSEKEKERMQADARRKERVDEASKNLFQSAISSDEMRNIRDEGKKKREWTKVDQATTTMLLENDPLILIRDLYLHPEFLPEIKKQALRHYHATVSVTEGIRMSSEMRNRCFRHHVRIVSGAWNKLDELVAEHPHNGKSFMDK